MNIDPLRAAYSAHVKATAPQDRLPCPSPDSLHALAERLRLGSVEGDADPLVLEHVLTCEHCRSELALLRTVVGAAASAGLIAPRSGPASATRGPWSRSRILVAASALLTVGIGGEAWRRSLGETSARVVRGERGEVALIRPAATSGPNAIRATDVREFVWHATDGAGTYAIEILDTTGVVLVSRTTPDTNLTLTDEERSRVATLTAFDWLVSARRADDNERHSGLVRVRVATDR